MPLWRKARLQVKENVEKNTSGRSAFGRQDVEKVHAVVAKHIWKSKCTKHTMFGPLLEVAISKKCAPLWREARLEVRMYKTPQVGAHFELAMSKECTPLWREAPSEVKMLEF